jgi:hypothetical protein
MPSKHLRGCSRSLFIKLAAITLVRIMVDKLIKKEFKKGFKKILEERTVIGQ